MYLVYMIVISFLIKCSYTGNSLNCENCYDKECVSQEVHKIAKKQLGKKADNFERKIEDEEDFFVISYINQEYWDNPLKKGGGEIMVKISKKDCKVVEIKRFQ